LGPDWQGRGMSLGSVTSFSSPSSISDIPELISVGNGSDSSSTSSGYGGDEESDFDSVMLDISDDDDDGEMSVGSLEVRGWSYWVAGQHSWRLLVSSVKMGQPANWRDVRTLLWDVP
jgi:hypothetical protein